MLNREKFIKNYFLINILILFSNCLIKIPLNFYPKDKVNFSEPSGIMEYYFDQFAYANFEIGSPKQKVQIPLKFDSNDFYIVDIYDFNYKENKFSGLKIYNSSKSETLDKYEEKDICYGDDFEMGFYYKDDFYFNDKKYSLDFYIPLSYDDYDSGGIGMQLYPRNYDPSPDLKLTFLEKLKLSGLTEKHIWTILYNSNKNILEDTGLILIGGFPEELNSDLGYYKKGFFKGVKKNVNMIINNNNNRFTFGFEIDAIYGYQGNNNKLIDDFPNGSLSFKKVELLYDCGGIYLPKSLYQYYIRVFDKYINKECFEGKFNGRTNSFYYCNNKKNIIKEIKESFPIIILKSFDFAFNFTLDANDLLVEHDNYVICLIYFSSTSENNFKLGKPFLKKYLFSFNYEDKNLYFYISEEKEEKKGVSIIILIVSIIATIIVVSVIFFLIFKFFLYGKLFRKKRANELDDAEDEYDYTSKEDVGNGGLINSE